MKNETVIRARDDSAPANDSGVMSRRSLVNMLVRSSAVVAAAVASPELAKPAAADPVAPPLAPPAAAEPTRIAKLWVKRNAVHDRLRAADRVVHRIEREAWRRAGAADPAIAYSTANDRLGLERWGRCRDPYIDPGRIRAALRKINGEVSEWSAFRLRRPAVLSKRDAKREQRLTALLKISQEHDAKVRGFRNALGYEQAVEKQEAILDEQGELECRIVKMRSASVGDLQIKFAIAEVNGCADKEDLESIARDVRQLMQRPALAQAFAEA